MADETRSAALCLRWWHHVTFRLLFLVSLALLIAGILESSTFDCAMAWLGLFLSALLRDEYIGRRRV